MPGSKTGSHRKADQGQDPSNLCLWRESAFAKGPVNAQPFPDARRADGADEARFSKRHGNPHAGGRRVPSGIIFINCNGLRWHDAPKKYAPPKTLCCRWKRWGDKGIFARMMEGPAFGAAVPTRCDQCPQVFLSAIGVAAIVLFRR